jgi:hypothetical protein
MYFEPGHKVLLRIKLAEEQARKREEEEREAAERTRKQEEAAEQERKQAKRKVAAEHVGKEVVEQEQPVAVLSSASAPELVTTADTSDVAPESPVVATPTQKPASPGKPMNMRQRVEGVEEVLGMEAEGSLAARIAACEEELGIEHSKAMKSIHRLERLEGETGTASEQ